MDPHKYNTYLITKIFAVMLTNTNDPFRIESQMKQEMYHKNLDGTATQAPWDIVE